MPCEILLQILQVLGTVGLFVQIEIDFVGGFVYALDDDFYAIAQTVFDTAIC